MTRFLLPVLALALLYYVWRHPEGWSGLRRLLRPLAAMLLALLYLRVPFDLVPDALPAGFLDDLAVLLAAFYLGKQPEHPQTKRSTGGEHHRGDSDPDPYEILGVARGSSREEISAAYRDKMKQYHPDRVADLGEELRQVAHEKSVEIQRAYARLKKTG